MKSMDKVQLGQRQIFLMKKENLAKRVQDYYAKNKNIDYLIQYMVAILVRSSLCAEEISESLIDLVREVYLTSESSGILRQYSPYFKNYFSENEWKQLITKLFKNDSNYFAGTEEARFYNNYLQKEGTLNNRREDLIYHVESIFEDANGKKHKLTIRDTDPTKDVELTTNILRTLTTLTVFETTGIRKFVEFVSYKTVGTLVATSYDVRKEEKALVNEENNVDNAKKIEQSSEAQEKLVQSETINNDTDKTLLVQQDFNSQLGVEKLISEDSNLNKANSNHASDVNILYETVDDFHVNRPLSGKKAAFLPQKRDTSYRHFAKSEAQIEEERSNKRLQREVNKQIGKKKKTKKRK